LILHSLWSAASAINKLLVLAVPLNCPCKVVHDNIIHTNGKSVSYDFKCVCFASVYQQIMFTELLWFRC